MGKRHFEAHKKTYHADGADILFRPWDEDDYFVLYKSGSSDDPLLQTDNVDVIIKWTEENKESFYRKCFDSISDSKYTQFVEKFLADATYRKNFLLNGAGWEGTVKAKEKPPIHPKCTSAIKRIEKAKESKLKFKDFAQLKTYGRDSFSRKKVPELEELVGEAVTQEIKTDARMEDEKLYASALKWCARGLSPQHAVRKVMTDKEISENSRGKY